MKMGNKEKIVFVLTFFVVILALRFKSSSLPLFISYLIVLVFMNIIDLAKRNKEVKNGRNNN